MLPHIESWICAISRVIFSDNVYRKKEKYFSVRPVGKFTVTYRVHHQFYYQSDRISNLNRDLEC